MTNYNTKVIIETNIKAQPQSPHSTAAPVQLILLPQIKIDGTR